MNRSEMATALRRYLNELGAGYVGTTHAYDALKDAAEQLNRDANFNRANVVQTLSGGVQEYTFPGTVMDVYRVRIGAGTDRQRLKPTSAAASDVVDGDWEANMGSGTPTEYYTDGNTLGVKPWPYAWTTVATNTRYATAAYVISTANGGNGYWYKCQTAGTARHITKTWPTTSGSTVTAGTVTFKRGGSTRLYLRVLKNPASCRSNGTTVPSWLPVAFHKTIPKLAAVDIATGYDADKASNVPRVQKLYQEYLADVMRLRGLADGRSREEHPQLRPAGYGGFRR